MRVDGSTRGDGASQLPARQHALLGRRPLQARDRVETADGRRVLRRRHDDVADAQLGKSGEIARIALREQVVRWRSAAAACPRAAARCRRPAARRLPRAPRSARCAPVGPRAARGPGRRRRSSHRPCTSAPGPRPAGAARRAEPFQPTSRVASTGAVSPTSTPRTASGCRQPNDPAPTYDRSPSAAIPAAAIRPAADDDHRTPSHGYASPDPERQARDRVAAHDGRRDDSGHRRPARRRPPGLGCRARSRATSGDQR